MIIKLMKFFFLYFYAGVNYRVKINIKLILFLKKNNFIKVASYFSNNMQKKYGVFISPNAEFDTSLCLKHPIGVVIGDGVKVGKNVIIYQNVTIGGARIGDAKQSSYPEIGEGVVIFAGAVIVGKIKIGKGSVIGANAVVTKDIPDNSVAAGVPARIVKEKI